MTAETPIEEQERFLELLEATEAERPALLAAFERSAPGSRARLERLLAAHSEAEGHATAGAIPSELVPEPPRLQSGDRIADFEITGILGEGGMGVVYEARQLQPRRPVALKVVRPHLATASLLRRFEREAEILARLQHPGIAQVIAAGRSEATGTPWFAMERIDGVSLTQAARDLSQRDRVRLMARVVEAVAHAHQRGVVHRDLKPSNVLVTAEGMPKVIDFGIGCLLDPGEGVLGRSTEVGQVFGTLHAMSPEQVAGDPSRIDTRTDVYALGVMLYETLAGRHPLDLEDVSLARAVERIRSAPPRALGEHDPHLRGDLEAIAACCLRKEPDRRYASASALAEDLGRHLRGEPVAARPPSAAYLLGRFARRHRTLVASAAVVLVVIVVALIVTLSSLVRALDAEEKARRAARTARAEAQRFRGVNAMFRDLMSAAALRDDGERDPSALLFDALARLERAAAEGDPLELVGLHEAVGLAANRLGLLDDAEHHLEEARRKAAALGRQGREEMARIAVSLSRLRFEQGRHEAARDLAREALDAAHRLGEPGTRIALDAWSALVDAQEYLHDHAGAAASWRRWRAAEVQSGASPLRLVSLDLRRGTLATRRGDAALAGEILREALANTEAALGPDHARVAAVLSTLAVACGRQGEYEEATGLLERAIAIRKKNLGERHVLIAHLNHNLGVNLSVRGRHEASRDAFEAALSVYRQVYPRQHPRIANLLANLGSLEKKAGNLSRGRDLLREAYEIHVARGSRTPEAAAAMRDLAQTLPARSDERQALLEEALEIQREILDEDSLDVTNTIADLGLMAYGRGELERAESLMTEALQRHRRRAPGSIHVGLSLMNLGAIHRSRDRLEAATRTLQEAVTVLEGALNAEHPTVARALHHLARAHSACKDHEAAREALERAAKIRAKATPKHAAYPLTLFHLAITLGKLDRPAKQLALLRRAQRIATDEGHDDLRVAIEAELKRVTNPGS